MQHAGVCNNTHKFDNNTVELSRVGVGGVKRIRSSRRLPTDSVDNLETDQTDSIAVWRTTWILIDIDNFFNNDDIMTS